MTRTSRATLVGAALTALFTAVSYAGPPGTAGARPVPSPTPSPTPTVGENGCRDVVDGSLYWHQDRITTASAVQHGTSGAVSLTAYLAAPSCPTVDYRVNVYTSAGALVYSNHKAGDGQRPEVRFAGALQFNDPLGIDTNGSWTCLRLEVQTLQDGVVQDTAPDGASPAGFQVCDDNDVPATSNFH